MVNNAKFGNGTHFMSFAAIIDTRNGTKGSNFYIRKTIAAIVKMSDSRLVCIIAYDSPMVLTDRTLSLRFFQLF